MSVEVQEVRLPHRILCADILKWASRLGLRWAMVYIVLYILLDPIVAFLFEALFGLPPFDWIISADANLWNAVIPWVGSHILAHPIHSIARLDPLEGVFKYLQDGIILVWALAVAVVWTWLDRDRRRERAFYEFTRILARFTLAITMVFYYGIMKLIPCGFFWCPGPAFLMEPFGNLSLAQFMWFFFGSSTLYSSVIGLGEIVGGTLLFFRRTTTIGALLLTGILVNVVLMDISYNTDVRRFAANLALMAIFLVAPDAQRIIRVLLGCGVAPADPIMPARPNVWRVTGGIVATVLIIGRCLWYFGSSTLPQLKIANAAGQHVPMGGYYQVEHFQQHERNRVATQAGESGWQMVAIDGEVQGEAVVDLLHVRTAASTVSNYRLRIKRVDATHGLFYLTRCPDRDHHCAFVSPTAVGATTLAKVRRKPTVLRYLIIHGSSQPSNQLSPDSAVLKVDGSINGAEVSMQLHHLAQSPFRLERENIQIIDPPNFLWEQR